MFAALVKVRKKDFCIVLAGKHQIKSRDRAPLRRDRDRPKQALFGAVGVIMLKPGARFSKVPRTFRARKAIRKTATSLFCKAGLFICCRGNKNKYNCKVSCLKTPSFWRYKENYVTRFTPEKFRDFRETGPRLERGTEAIILTLTLLFQSWEAGCCWASWGCKPLPQWCGHLQGWCLPLKDSQKL